MMYGWSMQADKPARNLLRDSLEEADGFVCIVDVLQVIVS
jgi:hypothetical protein